MEKPKVRPISAHPIIHEGRELILLSDTEGLIENPIVVSKDVLFLISLMDGTRTLRDLQEAYTRKFGSLIFTERVREILDFLDKNLLLENERYRNQLKELRESFEVHQERSPFHAGKSYPEDREELLRYISSFIENPLEAAPRKLKGIFSPHIDYRRGGHVYGSVYPYIRDSKAKLIVVLGTSHKQTDRLLNVCSKDFVTPLGTLRNLLRTRPDIKAWPFFQTFLNDWPHRTEHSIELQLPFIQYFLAEKEVEILPILVGSMDDSMIDSEEKRKIDITIEALKETLEELRCPYLLISAVDLAHIGLQFGEEPVDELKLFLSRKKDGMLLSYVEQVDAEAFFSFIRDERNERKVCGFSPLYVQLRLLKGLKGKIIKYDQWTDNLSSVSFASGIFYDPQ